MRKLYLVRVSINGEPAGAGIAAGTGTAEQAAQAVRDDIERQQIGNAGDEVEISAWEIPSELLAQTTGSRQPQFSQYSTINGITHPPARSARQAPRA
jgi:hypothetical protein